MAELQAVDLEKAERLDPSHERLAEALDDEQDARRALRGQARHRIEPADRLRVLETPGVGVHHAEEEGLVRGEVERDEDESPLGVQADEVDRSLPEQEARIDDLETGLDPLDVLGDQLLEVADVLDFQLLERGSHSPLPRPSKGSPIPNRASD